MYWLKGFQPFLLVLLSVAAQGSAKSTTATSNALADSKHKLQYRHGDIILGGAVSVHYRVGVDKCGSISEAGFQILETINMMIDKINSNEDILRGVKLGSIIVDTCLSEILGLKRVVQHILPFAVSSLGSRQHSICLKKYMGNGSNHLPILLGVVGASSSSVTIQIAKVLQIFSIPQVSYWATNSDLSDKGRFKYFFRTVPPDSYQVEAMMHFVKEMSWNYIYVVYDDDFYGVRGFSQIKQATEKNSICIADSFLVPKVPTSRDYERIVSGLLVNKHAKAVIIFARVTTTEKIFSVVQSKAIAKDRFFWIVSDAWANFLPTIWTDESYLDILDGAIAFSPKVRHVDEVDKYIANLKLEQHIGMNVSRNPWFQEYIELKNNCSANPVGNSTVRKCDPDEHILDPTFRTYDMLQNVANAVLAFAHATDAYHREVCNGKPGICQNMKIMAGTNGVASRLYHYLENVSFTDVNGQIFEFDDHHDGFSIYDVQVYNKDAVANTTNKLKGWIKEGIYQNRNITWKTDFKSKIHSVNSVCSETCGKGQATIPGIEICCWHCQTCNHDEYVPVNSSRCQVCKHGEKPSFDHDSCEAIPILEMTLGSIYRELSLALGILGLIMAAVTAFIFVKYRQSAIVKASGKELCSFVLFGAVITCSNCFLITSHASIPSCIASRIALAMGPSFMYSGLLIKTIRVVIIFRTKSILPKRMKYLLQPAPLTAIACGVAFIQIIVVIIWFFTDYPETYVTYPTEDFGYLACKHLVKIDILVGLIYPFVIIIACTILATMNRKVPTGFNETYYIGFTMYTTCIIWLAFLPIFLTSSTNLTQKLTTVSVCLSLGAETVLLCLFTPRCYTIIFHPEKNTAQTVMKQSRISSVAQPRDSSFPVVLNEMRKLSISELNRVQESRQQVSTEETIKVESIVVNTK